MTIQEMLDRAKPGQIVHIPEGEYHEDITVPRGVSVVGAGWKGTCWHGHLVLDERSGVERFCFHDGNKGHRVRAYRETDD